MAQEEFFDESVNEDSVGSGGFDLVSPGFYLVRVASVNEKPDTMEIDLEVIDGTKPSEIKKTHREFVSLNLKDGNRKRRIAFALATEILSRAAIKAAREAGVGLTVSYADALNRCLVVEIEHQAKQHQDPATGQWVNDEPLKMTAKIPYDHFWHIDDPSVAKKGVKIDKSKIDAAAADPFSAPAPAASKAEQPSFF